MTKKRFFTGRRAGAWAVWGFIILAVTAEGWMDWLCALIF